jgi:alkyl hydroperoxide reductase subunit AhpC
VILAASTATWLEQAARHLDDGALAGRVDHILADSHQRLAAAFGVLQRDGDCATAAIVIDRDGVVRQISTGARRPLALAA